MDQYPQINDRIRAFIEKQRMFFVATAGHSGRVNLSPKGMDTLRVLGANRVAWLNLTGSGNETAAHVAETARMTLMWCAFEGSPKILRLYGDATVVHPRDSAWQELAALFPPLLAPRQVFDLAVDLVQTSCGFGVPRFEFSGERDTLRRWAEKKGESGIRDFWATGNRLSIDGKPTGILGESDAERLTQETMKGT